MLDKAQAEEKPMVKTTSREARVREAAYRLYLARAEISGDASSDWAAAEALIDAEDGT